MKVQHVLAEMVTDQLHLVLLHASIKELAHGTIRPWGPHKVSRTDATDYELLWGQWPREDGLGIPGPGYWRDFRRGMHTQYGKLLRRISNVRFEGVGTQVTFDHIALEELNRGMLEQVAAHRDIR